MIEQTFARLPGRAFFLLMVVSLLLPSVAGKVMAQTTDIIPAANLTDWRHAGVPGGIPERTTIYQTFSPGATASQIQTALRSCPSGQVVYLNAGTYNLSGSIDVDGGSWTLRGAGMGKTILNGVRLVMGQYWDAWSAAVNVTAGGAKGSSNVTLSASTGFNIGGLVFFEQDNTSEIYGYGTGGTGSPTANNVVAGRQRDGNRVQHQMCRITAKSGNTLTIWPPLVFDLEPARNPRAVYHTQPGPQFAGLEDFTVAPNDAGNIGIWWQGSYGCWTKNVELTKWGTFGIEIQYCSNMEIRGCYIHDPLVFDWSKGYSLQLDPADTSLIVDNTFYKFQDGILLQGGAAGNVIAYNCLFRSYPAYNGVEIMLSSMFGNHTPYPCFNLWEGNYANQFHSDYYYGPSGYQTLLRNYLIGTDPDATQNRICVNIDAYQRHYSVVGNILGALSSPNSVFAALPNANLTYAAKGPFTWTYDPGSTSFGYSQNVIYRLGYPFIGNNGTGSNLAVHDNVVKTGTLIHGNWDAATKGVTWKSGLPQSIPNSLFLASKPAWFGNLNWPPYNPLSASSASITNIPAGYRLIYSTAPPGGSASQPSAPSGLRVVPGP